MKGKVISTDSSNSEYATQSKFSKVSVKLLVYSTYDVVMTFLKINSL